jgi:hypothetical protein
MAAVKKILVRTERKRLTEAVTGEDEDVRGGQVFDDHDNCDGYDNNYDE